MPDLANGIVPNEILNSFATIDRKLCVKLHFNVIKYYSKKIKRVKLFFLWLMTNDIIQICNVGGVEKGRALHGYVSDS